ncbi:MAG: DUF2341 domain-containing protein [Candidatus Bathyarchaeia archaeon]
MGWLTGWQYRKSHVINPATGAGTGYQVGIKVYYGTGTDGTETVDNDGFGKVYLNGKCRTDFGDVRFNDDDGSTLLDCWMEEMVGSSYALFWVEVADSLESSAQTIYIYYGKSDATYPYLASDLVHGEATFLIFDNFEDASFDTSKWSNQSATVTESGGRLRVDTTTTYSGVRSVNAIDLSTGKAMKARVAFEVPIGADGQQNAVGFCNVTGATTWWLQKYIWSPRAYEYTYMRWEFWHGYDSSYEISLSGNGLLDGNYHKATLKAVQGSPAVCWMDEFGPWSTPHNVSTTTWYLWISKGYNYADGYTDIDWVFIRKWVTPEPAHGSWGSEETPLIELTLTENLGLIDGITKSSSLTKIENLGLIDVYSRTWSVYRIYSEYLGLIDSLIKQPSKMLAETMGLLDSTLKSPSIAKFESLGLTDSIFKLPSIVKSESLGLLDSILKLPSIIRFESLGLLDSVLRSSSIVRSESLGLTDTFSRTWSVYRTYNELLGLLDVSLKETSKTLQEPLGLSDSFSKVWSVQRVFTESIGLTDSVSKGVTLLLTEILGLLDRTYWALNPVDLIPVIRKLIQLEEIERCA